MESTPLELKSRFPKILVIGIPAFLLGLVFNYFFYDKTVGISYPLYILLSLLALGGISLYLKVKISKNIFWSVLGVLFFAAMVCIRASGPLTAINILTSLFLL